MGTLTTLLFAPVMAPVWGFRFVLERLRDEAAAVLRDEGRGFAELIDLSMRHSAGKLSDEEFASQEKELLERLSSIRDYKDQLLNAERDADDDESAEFELDVEEEFTEAEPELEEVTC
jgi:hypothetical protein